VGGLIPNTSHTFKIKLTDEENCLTNIEIKNIGMAQAKNSIVNVISTYFSFGFRI
jgi:hypothetical protein